MCYTIIHEKKHDHFLVTIENSTFSIKIFLPESSISSLRSDSGSSNSTFGFRALPDGGPKPVTALKMKKKNHHLNRILLTVYKLGQ